MGASSALGNSFRLSFRIWTSIGILIIGYFISLAFAYYISFDLQSRLPNISYFAVTSTELSQRIPLAFEEQNRFYGNAVITGNSDMFQQARKKAEEVQRALLMLKALEGSSEMLQEKIQALQNRLKVYTDAASAVYRRSGAGETGTDVLLEINSLAEEKKALENEFKALSLAVQQNLSDNVSGLITDVKEKNSLNLLLSLGIIATAVIIIYWVIRRSIIGILFRITEKLYESSQRVAEISSEISTGSQKLAEGATEQAASVTQVSTALEQIASVTRQNAEYNRQARRSREETDQNIQQLNQAMDRTAGAMTGIKARGEEIGKVIQTINDITFQTNLLALNASGEAVRAGSAGAGFGVVANEVRELAVRSAGAAQETQGLIEKTVEEINSGFRLLKNTRQAFEATREQSSRMGDMIDRIARSSEDQVQGIEEISKTMNEIDQIVQQNASNAEVFASVFMKLNGQSERMSFFIRKLKGLKERRRQIRVKIALKGRFHVDGNDETIPFLTRDISAGGASIITDIPLELGTAGEIDISSTYIRFPWLQARVVRSYQSREPDKYLCGIEFIDISPQIEEVIMDLLSTDLEELL